MTVCTFDLSEHTGDELRMLYQALASVAYLRALRYLDRHPHTPRIYRSGVRYWEDPGPRWMSISEAIRKRKADCRTIAPWAAAELQLRDGIKAWPEVRCHVRTDGELGCHVYVMTEHGEADDPSRVLGMAKVKGPVVVVQGVAR